MRWKATGLWAAAMVVGLAAHGAPAVTGASAPAPVHFNRDVRPILSDKCFGCHGPDSARRKAGLRLDLPRDVFAERRGRRLIVPGSPLRSELIRRVGTSDPRHRMPPSGAGRPLTREQVALLDRWVRQGARWEKHWSLIPPARPTVPQVRHRAWVRNPIDAFVLQRLEAQGLAPSPKADPSTLIRRVTLDLTGLPPTPEQVDAFLADGSSDAYEKVVDRLLASPRYGERMAARWLDAARYADTNGYQGDGERIMWRWRDWVIDAYNRNMPFDQFTVEQLAGDLLPGATLDQRIATGFNRNHRGNGEGGIIPEEYLVEYVVDRVDTTSTVWLGLTLGCARCHDHKYDPYTQKDFYRLFAFFNNIPEKGRVNKYGNSPPIVTAPTNAQQADLARLDHDLAEAQRGLARLDAVRQAAQSRWEAAVAGTAPDASPQLARDWAPTRALTAYFPLDGPETAGKPAFGDAPAPAFTEGRIGRAAALDGKGVLVPGDVGDFGFYDRFTLSAWIRPRGGGAGTVLSRMEDVHQGAGYSVVWREGRIEVNLVQRWLDDALRVETKQQIPPGEWRHVAVTYDGSRVGTGVRVYIDGVAVALRVVLDELNQDFRRPEPLRIGGGGPGSLFLGLIDEVRVYSAVLSPEEVELVATPESIREIAASPRSGRSRFQAAKLAACFVERDAPEPVLQARRRIGTLREEREKLVASFPTTMVMEEMPERRDTFLLIRGEYNRPGERVDPGVPAALPPIPRGGGPDRLGLARWLTAPAHPLTGRVAVNRLWQMLFGSGLVRTPEDFGSQGEPPTHPELLDWLAVTFMSGRMGEWGNGSSHSRTRPRSDSAPWNVKALLRLIVTSATYRQSSKGGTRGNDPENRLLARGPRLRLSAEMIRDQALYAAGLLVETVGGPSVRPYQPPGLWIELAGGEDYRPDTDQGLYRRSLYTYWKRTSPPPAMGVFDAAGREACVVRESRTNTPLQALNLMNDVTYVEAARNLAQRVLRQAPPSPGARVDMAFRLLAARRPRAAERQVLLEALQYHQGRFQEDPAAARRFLTPGASPADPSIPAGELAAYTAVCSMILNLDEAITRE